MATWDKGKMRRWGGNPPRQTAKVAQEQGGGIIAKK